MSDKQKIQEIKNYLETYGKNIGSWGGWSVVDGKNIKVTVLEIISRKKVSWFEKLFQSRLKDNNELKK